MAARTAACLGIQVRGADLQQVWQQQREAMQSKQQMNQPGRGDEARRPERTNRPAPQQERPGKER